MTYQGVLKSVGYPEQVLILDFETYFDTDYTLSKLSTVEYVQNVQFDFLGCGFGNMHETLFVPKPKLNEYIAYLQTDENYGKNFDKNITVVAKNCKFDMLILSTKFNIIPPYIIDIDDLLRHYDARMSHKMKDVAPMFGLQPKGDTNQFKGLHYEEMSNTQTEALATYCKKDVQIETDLFKSLLPQTSNPTVEIPIARHTLGLYLTPSFVFDFKKAGELEAKMLMELENIIDATGFTKKQLSSNLDFVRILQAALPEGEQVPTKPGKPGKNMTKLLLGMPGVIPAFAKDDPGFQDLLLNPVVNVRNLCKARQAVKSWPLHIKRINNMADQADASGGLLRVPLHYYGGHTGRWSGGEGINLQNLGGRGRAGSGTHPLIAAMRSLLTAPDGSMLGIADSAQIEARLLAWLAGQDDLTEGFAKGEDIYSVFASDLFQCFVYKALEDDPPLIKAFMKIKRGFGKDAILGCGYGMGAAKFHQRCIANENLRPLFDSGEYNFAFIDKLIKTYRTTYAKIPQFWQSVEKAFKWVIKYPHEQVQVCIQKKDINDIVSQSDFLAFWNNNGTVHLRLPSGRELTYRHCALKKTTKGSEIRWHWGHLWGGSITENVVQSVARDLLAWWILEMEKVGLNVIFTNHDEIMCMLLNDSAEPPPTSADMGLDDMLAIMRTGPDWAAGLPLDAEGCLSECYKK